MPEKLQSKHAQSFTQIIGTDWGSDRAGADTIHLKLATCIHPLY